MVVAAVQAAPHHLADARRLVVPVRGHRSRRRGDQHRQQPPLPARLAPAEPHRGLRRAVGAVDAGPAPRCRRARGDLRRRARALRRRARQQQALADLVLDHARAAHAGRADALHLPAAARGRPRPAADVGRDLAGPRAPAPGRRAADHALPLRALPQGGPRHARPRGARLSRGAADLARVASPPRGRRHLGGAPARARSRPVQPARLPAGRRPATHPLAVERQGRVAARSRDGGRDDRRHPPCPVGQGRPGRGAARGGPLGSCLHRGAPGARRRRGRAHGRGALRAARARTRAGSAHPDGAGPLRSARCRGGPAEPGLDARGWRSLREVRVELD